MVERRRKTFAKQTRERAGKLRPENERLRKGGANTQNVTDEGVASAGEKTSIAKVQAVHVAMVDAYGADSSRAQELAKELEELRAAKRDAKPMSRKIRDGEDYVGRKRKALEAAKKAAVDAEEAVKTAQAKLQEAQAEIS